jgi:recombination protein RecA
MSDLEQDIQAVVGAVTKKYGSLAASTMGDREIDSAIKDWVSTQCAMLDIAISGGKGIPVGRISLIRGRESAGKTALATHILAETQRRGGIAVLLDTEYSYDPSWARTLGIDLPKLIVGQPDTMEEAWGQMFEMINLIRTTHKDRLVTVVWDSVASSPPEAELKGEVGDATYGLPAKLVSQGMRNAVKRIAAQKICLVFVNQVRENVGVTFGPTTTMIAEHPLMFHSSVVIDLTRTDILTNEKTKEPWAIKVRAKVLKNKVAPPFREAEFLIRFDMGIDKLESLLKAGVKLGIIQVAGAYYKIGISPGFLAKDAKAKLAELDIDLEQMVRNEIKASAERQSTSDEKGNKTGTLESEHSPEDN